MTLPRSFDGSSAGRVPNSTPPKYDGDLIVYQSLPRHLSFTRFFLDDTVNLRWTGKFGVGVLKGLAYAYLRCLEYNQSQPIFSIPPINGLKTSGITTEPSSC